MGCRARFARLYAFGGDGAQRRFRQWGEEGDGVEGVACTHHVDARRAAVRHDRLEQLAVRPAPVRLVLIRLLARADRLGQGEGEGEGEGEGLGYG